ncbi:MAG: tetratricopeptide repeat protein [Simplicispira sp.]|nr:tetratricopeptide repeat protein [Simplicispira sp.]
MHPTPSALKRIMHRGVRLMALSALLASPLAQADDYSNVNQLLRQGKHTEALARADQYLASKPRDPQMRFLKGVIQSESGKTSEATATFVKLTEEFPELPEPYNNLAVLYASQGQYDKARIALEMALRTNPSYATAQENLGDVYARMASQAYNKALQLDTGNTAVQPKLAVIHELFSVNPKGAPATKTPTRTPTPASTPPTAPAPAPAPASPAAPAPSAAPVPAAPAPTPASVPAVVPTPSAAAAPKPAPTTAPKPAVVATAPAAAAEAREIAPPAPAPAPAAATDSAAQKSVEAAVRAWALAWSSQNMDGYLGAYDKSFDPPRQASRKSWEEERRARIVGKSSIQVKISNLKINVKGNQATAQFQQGYSAGKLQVSSRKTLDLVKSGTRWLIVRESTGG